VDTNRQITLEDYTAKCEAAAGLDDWGDPRGLEALERICDSARRTAPPEASLVQLDGRVMTAGVRRLQMVADRKRYPQIARQRIEGPLIVVGLPRSGTTILHALLAQDPASRARGMRASASVRWRACEKRNVSTDGVCGGGLVVRRWAPAGKSDKLAALDNVLGSVGDGRELFRGTPRGAAECELANGRRNDGRTRSARRQPGQLSEDYVVQDRRGGSHAVRASWC